MGKRKMHGVQYYQCDWTAVPMRQSNCYLPSWSADGKMTKHGSYCNWEAVLAHAEHKFKTDGTLTLQEYEAVEAHIKDLTGYVPDCKAFHFSFLEHFKSSEAHWSAVSTVEQNWTIDEYYDKCSRPTHRLIATIVSEEGNVYEVGLLPRDGKYDLENTIEAVNPRRSARGEAGPDPPIGVFQSLRKCKSKEREISVYYRPDPTLKYNTTASQIFKMQLFGAVLIVQKVKELSNKPRERYLDFQKSDFEAIFVTRKRKKSVEPVAISKEEYCKMADEMQTQASTFEAKMMADVETPSAVARAAVMPPSTGKELYVAVEMMEASKRAKLESRMRTGALSEDCPSVVLVEA